MKPAIADGACREMTGQRQDHAQPQEIQESRRKRRLGGRPDGSIVTLVHSLSGAGFQGHPIAGMVHLIRRQAVAAPFAGSGGEFGEIQQHMAGRAVRVSHGGDPLIGDN
jgi:hypothetical protein